MAVKVVKVKCTQFVSFVYSTFCELSTLFYRVNVGKSETCSHLTINNKTDKNIKCCKAGVPNTSIMIDR